MDIPTENPAVFQPPTDGAAAPTPPAEGGADIPDMFKAPAEGKEAPAAQEKPADAPVADEWQPKTYDKIKFPDGAQVDEAQFGSFKEFLNSQKIGDEQAQALVDFSIQRDKQLIATHTASLETYRRNAEKTLREDADYGGRNISATYEDGFQFLDKHAFPETKKLFEEGGYVHPQIMKEFARIYRAHHKEAGASHRGEPPNMNNTPSKSIAHEMYPNHKPK